MKTFDPSKRCPASKQVSDLKPDIIPSGFYSPDGETSLAFGLRIIFFFSIPQWVVLPFLYVYFIPRFKICNRERGSRNNGD